MSVVPVVAVVSVVSAFVTVSCGDLEIQVAVRGPAKAGHHKILSASVPQCVVNVTGEADPYRMMNGLGTSVAIEIQTLFVCRYSLIISAPASRPRPEFLKPPTGTCTLVRR